jgi:DDE superfamily endonuclease
MMELPMLTPAPVVTKHAAVFRDLFDNQCQFRHFQHDLTGLIVLPNKSLANMARCILDSADKTNLSRFLSEAPWREEEVNRRRIRFMLQQTKPHRRRRRDSLVVLDDTLCEHVGRLFDDVDRHYNHGDSTYPLAHHPVTSFSVSGPVRFPLDLRLYRRDEELTPWEAAVAKHFPALKIPIEKKARNRLHQPVDPVWLQDPEFRARHQQFRTKMALAIDLVEAAIRRKVPVGVVVFDAWYLAEDLVRVLARRRKDWISLLKKNRRLETASFHRRNANGWAMPPLMAPPVLKRYNTLPSQPSSTMKSPLSSPVKSRTERSVVVGLVMATLLHYSPRLDVWPLFAVCRGRLSNRNGRGVNAKRGFVVRLQQEGRRDRQAKCLRRLEVDGELELHRLFDRQVSRLGSLRNLVHIGGGTPQHRREARAVGHQAPGVHRSPRR